ncbi:putative dioxygenase [Candidatus Rhodobacter oscarellae]|uniref:Putative dioxygenase n=1 Tax=Candidatus Rhodobacter oscarellae TaxID=1675527 RepID=A0A0J9GVB2_9RHOB|nr:VOC family protein [Candidatus Rhodobacter lobularis]KMW57513.1 putative dioxygenase [Candidatus Rhodobacter lobularis]
MLQSFDHVNVKTGRLEEMVAWYADILDLYAGWRPSFPFPGAWLYLGDHPYIHLVGMDTEPVSEDPKIEHYAFRATGKTAFLEKLAARGVVYQLSEVQDAGIVQVNIFDPDGNHIHIDFALNEAA